MEQSMALQKQLWLASIEKDTISDVWENLMLALFLPPCYKPIFN